MYKNDMISHATRMREIEFWAIPKEGSPKRYLFDKLIKEFGKHPQVDKKIKKVFNEAKALIKVQIKNGSGFPVDQQLREYNLEYNNRVIQSLATCDAWVIQCHGGI